MSLIKVGSKTVYVTPTGLRLGSRGKVQPPAVFLTLLAKGERRQVRKALHAAGLIALAATK